MILSRRPRRNNLAVKSSESISHLFEINYPAMILCLWNLDRWGVHVHSQRIATSQRGVTRPHDLVEWNGILSWAKQWHARSHSYENWIATRQHWCERAWNFRCIAMPYKMSLKLKRMLHTTIASCIIEQHRTSTFLPQQDAGSFSHEPRSIILIYLKS